MTEDAAEQIRQTSETAIVDAKIELDAAAETYSSVLQAGTPRDVEGARVRLHRAVIGLWWRMRPALVEEEADCWDSVEDVGFWDSDVIWSGRHPKTEQRVVLEGLSDLNGWVDRTSQQRRVRSGPKLGGSPDVESVPLRLPGEAALNAAAVLTHQFREFGWGAKIDSTPRTEIGEDLMDEVHKWMDQNVES